MSNTRSPSLRHALVWLRNDIRLADNPALFDACQRAKKVTVVYLRAEKQWQQHDVSANRIDITYRALSHLNHNLAKLGIVLRIESAPLFKQAPTRLKKVIEELDCDALFFNYEYALDEVNRDKAVTLMCQAQDIAVFRSNASLIIPPGKVTTQNGQPFKVFTPFKKAWLQLYSQYQREPLSTPKAIGKPIKAAALPLTESKNALAFDATEKAAQQQLTAFIEERAADYNDARNIPSQRGTSEISPYLAIGVLSPRQCLHAVHLHNGGPLLNSKDGSDTWVSELIWREFYLHVLAANPSISKGKAMRPATEQVPWRYDKKDFAAWCEGRTGFPLVDAAMLQLNQTGWMHNRLRMVTATFLTKYLLIDWRWGEKYFMQKLLDGHFAANNGGWQWCASTGTDAAPYFRILQPVRQAERFDPNAQFIKQFLPQLASLPSKIIHQPGHPDLLATGYPSPIIDLAFGRQRCLEAFKALPTA